MVQTDRQRNQFRNILSKTFIHQHLCLFQRPLFTNIFACFTNTHSNFSGRAPRRVDVFFEGAVEKEVLSRHELLAICNGRYFNTSYLCYQWRACNKGQAKNLSLASRVNRPLTGMVYCIFCIVLQWFIAYFASFCNNLLELIDR